MPRGRGRRGGVDVSVGASVWDSERTQTTASLHTTHWPMPHLHCCRLSLRHTPHSTRWAAAHLHCCRLASSVAFSRVCIEARLMRSSSSLCRFSSSSVSMKFTLSAHRRQRAVRWEAQHGGRRTCGGWCKGQVGPSRRPGGWAGAREGGRAREGGGPTARCGCHPRARRACRRAVSAHRAPSPHEYAVADRRPARARRATCGRVASAAPCRRRASCSAPPPATAPAGLARSASAAR